MLALRPCVIKLLGQAALLEAKLPLTLAATKDVDVYADYDFAIEHEFRRLLAARGCELDSLGGEVWMPKETTYQPLFVGASSSYGLPTLNRFWFPRGSRLRAKKQPLLTEYLARDPSVRFLELAHQYRLDLEQFL